MPIVSKKLAEQTMRKLLRPCRRFVRLSGRSRARTHPAAENQTLRRRAGALAKNARIGKNGSGKSRLRQMQENAENGQNRGILDAAARKRRASRTKPRGRAYPAAITSARGADSLRLLLGRSIEGQKQPQGVPKSKYPAVSGITAGFQQIIESK